MKRASTWLVAVLTLLSLDASRALGQEAGGDPSPASDTRRASASAPDLSTPRRTIASFLRAARADRWDDAALALDMREIPTARRAEAGPRTARSLATVLDARGVRAESVPEEVTSDETAVEITHVAGEDEVVALRRVHHGGVTTWLFTPANVRAAARLAAHVDRGPIGNLAPRFLVEAQLGGLEAWQWIALAVALALAWVAGWALGRSITAIACRLAERGATTDVVRSLLTSIEGPLRTALFLGVLGVLVTFVHLPDAATALAGRVASMLWAITIAWLFLRLVDFGAREVADRAAERDGWRARGTRTRIMVLRRVVRVTGIVVSSAVVLMQFDSVRQVGLSLLASAGVAGIVVGLAAQRTIGNLLAGIQLSFTQPLRVGDEVVVEGQFGTVEEINLSYVVVKIWDQRRLIVPMTKLLESAFENWTRASTELLGEVKVPVDFGTPFERLREEVVRFVKAHPLFDGRTLAVQVTDAKERTAEVRVLVSAADSSKLFELRCATREFVLGALQRLDEGRYLPRVRVNSPDAHDDAAADAAE